VLGALVYVYGHVRRFLGPPVWSGLAWGAVLFALAGAALLPRLGPVIVDGLPDAAPAAQLTWATLAVVELLAGSLLYGLVVGWANPRRDR
jgi:hypothetical protein